MPKEKLPKPRLERSTFITSRQLEYFSPEELEKQIAYPINYWPLAITKELIDNSLDACEAIPVPPLIIVTVANRRITVADNAGPGLPKSILTRSQDYAVTVSNKAHYRSPLRGRQGNALKTVWAAPFVFNGGCEGEGKGRIEVITPSYAVEVVASLNRIRQEPDLKTTVLERPFVTAGTTVTVDWIREARYFEAEIPDFYKTVLDLLQSYALFNPHAGFRLCHNGETLVIATPIVDTFEKWLPSDPTPPHWYNRGNTVKPDRRSPYKRQRAKDSARVCFRVCRPDLAAQTKTRCRRGGTGTAATERSRRERRNRHRQRGGGTTANRNVRGKQNGQGVKAGCYR